LDEGVGKLFLLRRKAAIACFGLKLNQ